MSLDRPAADTVDPDAIEMFGYLFATELTAGELLVGIRNTPVALLGVWHSPQ